MRAQTILAALLLSAAALALTPPASAIQGPPQCMTMDSCCGIEPGFAPCCTVLECPPQLIRCPTVAFDSTHYVQFAGPWVTASMDSRCTAEACLQTEACCTVDGRESHCSTPDPLSALSAAPSCPPRESDDGTTRIVVNRDCSVLVEHKPYDCVWNCGWVTYLQGPPVTIRVYQQTTPPDSWAMASAPAAGIELPSPCGPTAMCQGPECPETVVSSAQVSQLPGGSKLATSAFASVTLRDDCSVDVEVRTPPCSSLLSDRVAFDRTVKGSEVRVEMCWPEMDCTCPPMMAAAPR